MSLVHMDLNARITGSEVFAPHFQNENSEFVQMCLLFKWPYAFIGSVIVFKV